MKLQGGINLHKPIFILIEGVNQKEAKENAKEFIEDKLIDGSFDWFQGIKESQRWPELEKYEKPKLAKYEKKFIEELILRTQKEIHFWLDKGLQEIKEKGDKELGWTLVDFHIASGKTACSLFDSTNWSDGDGIRDKESLVAILKDNPHLWLCGFDIHY